MKRPIFNLTYLLILLVSIQAAVSAQSAQLLFEAANRDYLEGNYQQAVDKYHTILTDGLSSGEVYFNLGNAYYKLDEIGRAILYYEKARIILGNDEALLTNLKLAQMRTVDEIEPIPQLFLAVWWGQVLNLFSIEAFAWITLALFFVLSVLIVLNILSIRRMEVSVWIVSGILLLFLILFVNKVYLFETNQFGIILSDKVSIISEPNISGTEMFILHEGTKVQVLRSSGDWLEIKIADGKTGWLRLESIEYI